MCYHYTTGQERFRPRWWRCRPHRNKHPQPMRPGTERSAAAVRRRGLNASPRWEAPISHPKYHSRKDRPVGYGFSQMLVSEQRGSLRESPPCVKLRAVGASPRAKLELRAVGASPRTNAIRRPSMSAMPPNLLLASVSSKGSDSRTRCSRIPD